MARDSSKRSHGRSARWLLLLLVIIPLLPEIFIWIVAGAANLAGCRPGQGFACKIWSLAVSDMIEWALSAAGIVSPAWRIYFYLAIGTWLVVCFVVLIRGWSRVTSRLLIGAAVTLLFALLPVFGPWFAIDMVADTSACKPQSTDCWLFGEVVKRANGAFQKAYLAIPDVESLLIAGLVGIFLVFAIFVIASGAIFARGVVRSERAQS